MTAPLALALAFLGLLVSARTRLNAVLLGQPVSVPVLWLVALAVVLMIALAVVLVLRTIVRDSGLFLRPRVAGA